MVNFYTYLELYTNDLDKKVNLGDFERHFNTPHQTVKKRLLPLVREKILIEEKKKRLLFYCLNKNNPLFIEYLSICEKERLFRLLENPLFKRLYDTVSDFFTDSRILVFGSAAVSKDFNDIDILIFSENGQINKELDKFGKTYSVKLHIINTKEELVTNQCWKK